ncbi:MAG TPA: PadR family transcriptional regulator [Candidatus Competibacteraceae bacterium]|nr:PadR family transcriptional regulator [Candidatus Competibacteraceae bacterium]
MDIRTICLGVLTLGDATGYEIKKYFDNAFNHFFTAGYGSIYPALAQLTEAGLVTCMAREQERRPDKKVYSITAAGRRHLEEALTICPARHKVRSEFLVLMYFAHLLSRERLAKVIDARLLYLEELIDGLRACENDAQATPGQRFTAGFGIAVLQAAADYIRQNRHLVEQAEPVEAEVASV